MALVVNMRETVEAVLSRLRQNLSIDGCDVQLVDVTDEGVVVLKFVGGPSCCPMSQLALAMGLESALKDEVKGVLRVELAAGAPVSTCGGKYAAGR
jgi:Fe-S cluster biogenesis protein NfuA